jgi:CubicO group peptidase (beta-lactamase class C family)
MAKNILLILYLLISVTLFGQKKTKQPKVVGVSHPVAVKSLSRISPERNLRLTQREEAKKSLVVLKNEQQLLPLGRLDTLKVVVVSIGMGENNPLPKFIGRYIKADYLTIDPKAKTDSISKKWTDPANYNLIIFAIGEQNRSTTALTGKENQEDTLSSELEERSRIEEERNLPEKLMAGTKAVFMLYGSPRFLAHWENAGRASALLATEKADYDRMDLSAQLLFGAINPTGKLPFDLNNYKKGDGVSFPVSNRLSYVLPEELGIDSVRLSQKMDSLVGTGLREKAFPGCQLLLAQKGKVMYQKSYGFYTYDCSQPVQDDDLYDLASVTKVLAPVPALMMLADQKKFIVTKKMSDYWPDWKGSNKEGILVSDLLSHQARLRPGVVLWPKTVDNQGVLKSEYYSSQPTQGYDLRVSGSVYLIDSYPDTVYKIIKDSPLLKTKKYVYSDLGFVILPKVIENLSGETYQTFLQNRLYAKLGATTLMYQPYLTESRDKIVPTEDDRAFRHEVLQGFVHDETAALMGGISGNAGLFGSAGDVAKVMQLYLQNGEYGNERYISSETLQNWTSSHFKKTNNRRGFGFDKPGIQMNRYTGKESYPSKVVSEQSYGHSGYTGTFVWADPVKELLLVFLSNRVFPDRNNHKINKLKIRSLLLENLYKLAGEPSKGR